ncbi:flavodoxin domain-containing protein [Dethiothermospora halolimnae]|uniref:flavodoxin domain-containing protein n=1 Tax=Dethiothermospora halolimnae TaxID=3114390 RepID=UPI003CCB9069
MKSLIVFSTKCGTTEKCAKLIKKGLNGETDLVNLREQKCKDIDSYDNILIGGSVYIGKIRSDVKEFVEKNKSSLRNKNIGLFVLCQDEGEKAIGYIDNNFPDDIVKGAFIKEHLGHEINLDKMGFLDRTLCKKVLKVKESYSKLNDEAIGRVVEETNIRIKN